MRQKALDQGYTLNEHGICHLTADKKKGDLVLQPFPTEKSIFDFLGMPYRTPLERGSSPYMDVGATLPASLEPSPTSMKDDKKPKNKTLKKKGYKQKQSKHRLSRIRRRFA
jgi:hypothetical protein